jgi:AcrR family transcriptional regulator
MAEHGYGELTVAQVIAEAGVSRKTFYEYFANKQEAVLAAHEDVCERFLGLMTRACSREDEWPLKIRAAIVTAVDFAIAEPAPAQLLTVDTLSSNLEIARRVLDVGDHLAALLRSGREKAAPGVELPDLTEKALVGMISAIVASRLINGEAEMLAALEPQLVELTLIPYVGTEEATRVAGRTV